MLCSVMALIISLSLFFIHHFRPVDFECIKDNKVHFVNKSKFLGKYQHNTTRSIKSITTTYRKK